MARMFLKKGIDRDGKEYIKGWYADFQKNGTRRKVSLRTKDEKTARAKLAKLELLEAQEKWDPAIDPVEREGVTVKEAVRLFVLNRERHCSPVTVQSYKYVLERFVRMFPAGTLVRSVSTRHISRFLALPRAPKKKGPKAKQTNDPPKPLSDRTKKDYEAWLRIFFSWCKEEGIVSSNPVPQPEKRGKARHVGKKDGPPPFLTEEQLKSLITAIEADAKLKQMPGRNQWLIDAILFSVGTGLRRSELIHLRWDAVDIEVGLVHVVNTEEFTTKSGKERSVPLVGEATKLVRRLKKKRGPDATLPGGGYVFRGATGGKIGLDYFTKRFRHYRKLAKLPEDLHLHSLRHTFASWFVQRKGDLYFLKKIMGHESIKTTMKYAHLRPDALRSEMEYTFGAGLYGGPRKGPHKMSRPPSMQLVTSR